MPAIRPLIAIISASFSINPRQIRTMAIAGSIFPKAIGRAMMNPRTNKITPTHRSVSGLVKNGQRGSKKHSSFSRKGMAPEITCSPDRAILSGKRVS